MPAPASLTMLLMRARSLAKAGKRAEAAATYRAVLARFPDNSDARAGLVALQPAAGIPAARRNELRQLLAGGKAEEVLARLKGMMAAHPGDAELHFLAGNALAATGRAEAALKQFLTAHSLNPRLARARFMAGNMLYLLGRREAAAAIFEALVRADPNDKDALNNLGLTLHGLGRLAEAEAAFARAVALAPGNAEFLNNLGLARHELGRSAEAEECYRRALAIAPGDARTAYNLANTVLELGRAEEAVAGYRRALEIDSGYADAANNLGNVLRDQGDTAGAVAAYRQAIAARPEAAVYYRNLADLHRFLPGDPLILQMEALLARAASDADRMYLSFALGNAYDRLGETERAFAAFAEGNRLRKAELGYEIAVERKLFATLRRYFGGDLPEAAVTPGPRPVFVLGMMRSGTTLVEQILASHSRVRGLGELEFLTRASLPVMERAVLDEALRADRDTVAAVRAEYLAGIAPLAQGAAVVTDKMPLNFRWIGFILTAFPEARVVHLNRDPMAVGWSIFRNYFSARGNGHAYDLADIGAYSVMHADLMAFWHARFPGRIYELDYEALTLDQEGQSRALLDYCGLDWEPGVLEFHRTPGLVKTASSAQVRQAMYRGSSEEWKRYEGHLGALKAALEGNVAQCDNLASD